MRTTLESVPGVLLCVGLALAGEAAAARLGLPVPGPVLGLLAYLAWLLIGRGIAWSRPGAALLLRWIGAMVVPALVSLALAADGLAPLLLPLAAVMLATTLVTALATALIYRLAGGRN
jgi:holin-like protein